MKKILISDFDDTLYINKKINNDDLKEIHNFRKAGNIFVIASGSSYTSFMKKKGDYKLEYDYLIINHGSTIYKKDKIISNDIVSKEILNEIIEKYNINDDNLWSYKNPKGHFFSSSKEGLVKTKAMDITKIHLEFNKKL